MRAIQLYAGIGTMTRAFQRQNIEIVLAQESRETFAQIYRTNFPEISLVESSIEALEVSRFPAYELLLAQIHITPATLVGNLRDSAQMLSVSDEIMFVVRKTKPKLLCFSVFCGNRYSDLQKIPLFKQLSGEGYAISYRLLSSAEFGGVPFDGKMVYMIGYRTELLQGNFYFPEPIRGRALGPWYLQKEASGESLYRRIPGAVEERMWGEEANIGDLYRRRYRGNKEESENGEACQIVRCEHCPKLSRRSWYDTYVQTGQGIRRLTLREYLTLQGDEETAFPAEMSDSKIWECMSEYGSYPMEYRIARQIIKTFGKNFRDEENTLPAEQDHISEYAAAQFLNRIPEFTNLWVDKQLGILRMPVGTGIMHSTGRVAQGIWKRTKGKWKIVVLCSYLQVERMMAQTMEQYENTVRIQSLEELKQCMEMGYGGIFITTYLKWKQYTEQNALQNHNGICLICYDMERSPGFLSSTPKCLPQAYYIGISGLPETELSEELEEWFGEVKYEYRMSEAVRDRWIVPLYGEVLHSEEDHGILVKAKVRQRFAKEVFLDNLLVDKDETALLVVEDMTGAAEFQEDLLRLKQICIEDADEAAKEFGLRKEVLQERLEKSGYFLLTSSQRSADKGETLKKIQNQRRGILVVVSMRQGLEYAKMSAVYVRGTKTRYELLEIVNQIVKKYKGKNRARIVFCGNDQMELLGSRVNRALPEMQRLVQDLWSGDYEKGYQSLRLLKQTTGIQGRAVEELCFLYPKEVDREAWKEIREQQTKKLHLFVTIWCMASQYAGNFGAKLLSGKCSAQAAPEEPAEVQEKQEKETENRSVPEKRFATSYAQGVFLEKAVMELLRLLFRIDENRVTDLESRVKMVLDTLRRQKSGAQGGYDIRVEYLDASGKKKICLFECKYMVATQINLEHISGKLEQVKLAKEEVEHWILVAPKAKLANEVLTYLNNIDRHPGSQLPVRDVQIWTEENGVKELFGLIPELYHEIYKSDPTEGDAPECWPDVRRNQVLEHWRKKLLPVPLLPQGFLDYPERIDRLMYDVSNDGDLRARYEELYKRYIKLHYFDDAGRYSERDLECDMERWLSQKDHRIKVLLGEFGDGKTFFLYSFGRRLLEKFREDPDANYLPICFSLKRLGEAGNPSEFLEARMRELGATPADFLDLKQRYHVLICLDGLDEMSASLDKKSLFDNATRLIRFCRECKDVKILITSRKQCFLSYEIGEMLRDKLGGFHVWQLAHVKEEDIREQLYPVLQKAEEDQDVIDAMPKSCKWMELAGKPLFFEMIQALLKEGIRIGENENAIYDSYIHKCLQRKFDESFGRDGMWVKEDTTVERIYRALEELAVKMQMKNRERIAIAELSDLLDEPLPEILWKDSGASGSIEEDAQNRFSMRLLFKYEGSEEIAFAHRSIREFFVGKHLLQLLKERPDAFFRFIEAYACNFEVMGFLAEGIKGDAKDELVARLISFLPGCREKKSPVAAKILQICFFVDAEIPKAEWSGQNLDGVAICGADFSGQDLSNAWIRNANLNNVRLDDADCSNCDFSGSRLEETKSVEAVGQSGQQIRVIYTDGLIRDWKPERAESLIYWNEQEGFEKACLLDCGWIVQKRDGRREICLQTQQTNDRLRYWGIGQTEILDIAGSRALVTVQPERDGYLTAVVDCMTNEIQMYRRTTDKVVGRLDGEGMAVISDGQQVCIFSGEEQQEYAFPLPVYGQKEIAVRGETDNYRLAVLTEGRLILVSYQNTSGTIRKREILLPIEGLNHVALIHENRIALGNCSGTVCLVAINWEELEPDWENCRELRLGIYCRNTKTEGIIPEEIRRRLEIHCRKEEKQT